MDVDFRPRTLASQFIMNLPWATTWLPIILSTAYLWVVDTIALRQGTWVIEEGTKIDVQVWKGLEIEYVSNVNS